MRTITRLINALPLAALLSVVSIIRGYGQQDSLRKHATESVEVEAQKLTTVKVNGAFNTTKMNEGELFKAACCNLSESFETNPSIDVNFTDVLTGARQIQMLGLSGLYVQMMTENRPDTRGLFANYGLSYTPGTWTESIQVTKGAGSVVNGYESMTGLINIENKKPESLEKLYLNAYANHMGRYEANAVATSQLSNKWSTAVYLHSDQWNNQFDLNGDGFMDMPMSTSYALMNRWKYDGEVWKLQFGGKYLQEDRTAGELHSREAQPHHGISGIYEAKQFTTNWNAFMKLGRIFKEKPYQSVGLIAQINGHNQGGYYGMRSFNYRQESGYTNLIYQSIIGTTIHKFRTGLSLNYDRMYEFQTGLTSDTLSLNRTEVVPGAFYEHTWSPDEALTIIGGIRYDQHNLFGGFFTPRLHIKYNLNENSVIRLNAGRGQRTANLLADNGAALGSNRILSIAGRTMVWDYTLAPEVSWNYGLGYTYDFELFDGTGSLAVDAYRTDFERQVIADLETGGLLKIYSQDRAGYGNSIQAEVNLQPVRRLEFRLAYRFNDVQMRFQDGMKERPFIAAHRGFFNAAYTTRSKWAFDATVNLTGSKRLPSTTTNAVRDQFIANSPAFMTVNAQVTKSFKAQGLDVYVGVENLTDYRQTTLLIAPDRPFGSTFDASMVWGPVTGRIFYVGLRFKLMREVD